MKRYVVLCAILGVALGLWGSGVIPAIVPAAVPAANKQGNSSVFQLSTGSTPTAGNCATWDSSHNLIDSGISTCGGAGTAVNSFNGRTGAVLPQSGDYSYSQISSAPVSTTGPIASRPASSLAGNLYFPTDTWYTVLRDNGATWDYFLGGRKMTPPVSGNFTFTNQGSASASVQTNGAITLTYPSSGSGSGDSWAFYYLAAPGTPWTKTFRFFSTANQSQNSRTGICLQESGTSKMIVLDVNSLDSFKPAGWELNKFTNLTTFSAVYTQVIAWSPTVALNPIAVQISDAGGLAGNLTWSLTGDGGTFIQFQQHARNDFFTTGPDRVGFCLESFNTNGAQGNAYQTIVSVE